MIDGIKNQFEGFLKTPFLLTSYVSLVKNLFPGVRIITENENSAQKENGNFREYIDRFYHVGNYVDPQKNKMVILAIAMNKHDSLVRARSIQRNYIKRFLDNGGFDAAFVAFFTDGEPKWRLSFVRMDYSFNLGKIKETMTPAKRYSFLVGEGEPCHTALERLFPFFACETAPTLDALEEAFSVEKVTDEFFKLYCEKYFRLYETLEKSSSFQEESTTRGFTTEQFVKKLMGQIVFLYFIQKKGWLGINKLPKEPISESAYKNAFFKKGSESRVLIPKVFAKTNDGKYRFLVSELDKLSKEEQTTVATCFESGAWGSGPHDFMRKLFTACENQGKNFFDDFLEPLFYDALNEPGREDFYFPALHCCMPFLNGSLFEPINNYNWKSHTFSIPNEIFSNLKEKGRDADGILDVFDRFNFTMYEDEPMEREVAIDPEMLGKIFESLLETTERKGKGAFYTPRPIVHYICQECLIQYLVNKTGIPCADIREFILFGDMMRDRDKYYSNGQKYLISPAIYDPATNVNRLLEIDEALKTICVADPAVGSGAFPLGMLNEIVKARDAITGYLTLEPSLNAYQRRKVEASRQPYELKKHAIHNCIFAVDIEPSAVDIARLRLWLSLVIEDEVTTNAFKDEFANDFGEHRDPHQLPNLDCNIVCGNSLIDVIDGVNLINKSSMIGTLRGEAQLDIYQQSFQEKLEKLLQYQDHLFEAEASQEKKNLREKIQILKDEIIIDQLKGNGVSGSTIQKYEESKTAVSPEYFLWQLEFARVFKQNGGFSVVCGNPPYIQLQKEKIRWETDILEKMGFETFARTGDIYCLFYEKGNQLLHDGGVLGFITSNKWMRAGYGKGLREYFCKHMNPIILLDFAGQKIFDSATVDCNIMIASKTKYAHQTRACMIREKCENGISTYVQENAAEMDYEGQDSWTILSPIELSIKRKIEAIGTPLKDWDIQINYGIKTGCNEAFIISGEKKDELIAEDPKSAEIIRPILRGRDIKRYGYEFADLWLLWIPWHFPLHLDNSIQGPSIEAEKKFQKEYPAVYRHLYKYKDLLSNRNQAETGIRYEWYALQRWAANYWEDFSKQKIIYNDINQRLSFAICEPGMFFNNTVYFITNNEHIYYLLGCLNSNVVNWYYKTISVQLGEKAVRMFSIYVKEMRIPMPNQYIEEKINNLVQQLLVKHTKEQDFEINNLFYDLYGLSEEEINYIESIS